MCMDDKEQAAYAKGYEAGAETTTYAIVRALTRSLDGEDSGIGSFQNPELQALRERLRGIRAYMESEVFNGEM